MPNLVYALIWLAVAGGLLVWQVLHPQNPGPVIRGTGISFGWLALVLGIYNLVRWWSSWSYQRRRRELTEEQRDRPQSTRQRHPGQSPPNPDFDFSERPSDP